MSMPSATPTSLIWAAQLKREHAFLLERLQKTEIALQQVEKCLEKDARKSQDKIENLVKDMELLRSKCEINQKESQIRLWEPIANQMKHLQGKTEDVVVRVDTLQADGVIAEQDRRRGVTREKDFLKRLSGVEMRQREVNAQVERMQTSLKSHRDEDVRALSKELQHLQHDVEHERNLRRSMDAKVTSLEAGRVLLEEVNTALRKNVQSFMTRQATEQSLCAYQPSNPTGGASEQSANLISNRKTHEMNGSVQAFPVSTMGQNEGPPSTANPKNANATTSQWGQRLRNRDVNTSERDTIHGGRTKRAFEDDGRSTATAKRPCGDNDRAGQQNNKENQPPPTLRRGLTDIFSSPLSSPPPFFDTPPRGLAKMPATAPTAPAKHTAPSTAKHPAQLTTPKPQRPRRKIVQTYELPGFKIR